MSKARWIAPVSLVTGLALTGCVGVPGPPGGLLCTYARGPLALASDATAGAVKVGRAESHSAIFFTYGDASIAAAMADGGITRVHHVDYEVKAILGLLIEFTTVVYGE